MMQKKTCPNGHVYDPAIYGDQCPLCASGANVGSPAPGAGMHTHIAGPQAASGAGMHTHIAGPAAVPPQPQYQPQQAAPQPQDPAGATRMRPQQPAAGPAPAGGGHTVIRHAPAPGMQQNNLSRKLVGFLVSYNRDPNGRAYNIYEGRNYIGRDPGCDIAVTDDDQMSGRHLSILYRNVDGKFKFRDEQSSNGTFVNKELLDDGELQNYDIIRAGSTLFIFIAIPNIS